MDGYRKERKLTRISKKTEMSLKKKKISYKDELIDRFGHGIIKCAACRQRVDCSLKEINNLNQ